MKKVFITLAILIAAGVVAIVAIVSHASRDIPEPDVSDLAVDRPDVSPEDNAYTFFASATNTFYWPTNSDIVTDYLDGKPVEGDPVREVIVRNAEMMETLAKGLSCRICLAPEVTGLDTLLPYIAQWRNIGRVVALKARNERLAGNFAEATDTCVSLLRFADLIQHDAECILNYLVGIAVLELGLQQARDIAQDERTPADDLSRLSAALADLGPFDPGLIRAIKVEYKVVVANTIEDFGKGKFNMDDLMSLNGIDSPSILKGKRIPGYFFQPNNTKQTSANLYRDTIKNAPLCYAEMNLYDVEDVLWWGESKVKLITRPNAVGKILYTMFTPSHAILLERKCQAECGVAATRLVVAILAYEKKNGTFPKQTDDLIPVYMKAIPKDPYDGKPFRYSLSNNIVYSVGKDLKDSGGSSTLFPGRESDSPKRKRWNAEDIVFAIREEIEPVATPLPSESAPSEGR